MSLLLADDDGSALFTHSVNIPVTYSIEIQKRVNQFRAIPVTYTVAFTRLAKFFSTFNIPVTYTIAVQKRINQFINIPVTYAINAHKLIKLLIDIPVVFTIVASDTAKFFRSFDIPITFDIFVDALKIVAGVGSSLAGSIRNKFHKRK
jgi:hypothetical protein